MLFYRRFEELAESMRKRHAEELRSLDGECKAQSDFQREVETRQEDLVKMNLKRRRLGHQAAEIKEAIMAGDQKLVHSSYICNVYLCFTI